MTCEEGHSSFHDIVLTYRIHCPQKLTPALPLVVCLEDQASCMIEERFCESQLQQEHPAYVLAPLCPQGRMWDDMAVAQALQRLIFSIRNQHQMDWCRTYVVGVGQGAIGAWHILGGYPRTIAGTVAIGGCGDPYHVRNAKYAPVWAFHSRQDSRISVSAGSTAGGKRYLAGSRKLIAAIRTIGGELARYTECDTQADFLPRQALYNPEMTEWLFQQDRMKIPWVEFIKPGLWRIDDYFMASCYLIEGENQALMVDTGMATCHLLAVIQKLTQLPVALAITHPHLDHMMHAYTFDNVYMAAEDIAQIPEMCGELLSTKHPAAGFPQLTRASWPQRFTSLPQAIPITDGDVINLGGSIRLEVVSVGGHTPNHLVFIDHGHQCVFTGDAIGSGYVVGVNFHEGHFAEAYEEYRANLQRLLERLRGCEEYTFFGGHFIQENSCADEMQEDYLNGQSVYYNPLSYEIVVDMIKICDEILDHQHDDHIPADGGEFVVAQGSARLSGRKI